MASFADSRRGVACAIGIRATSADFNRSSRADPREDRPRRGEPVEDSNDLFGATVQLAARLCSEPSRIRSSSRSSALRARRRRLFKAGSAQLKGFAGMVGVVECVWTA